MKKLLLTICASLIMAFVFAQTIVSTSVDNRKAVLGEFTGIYCTWCPEGHEIAHNLGVSYPNDFFAINYHYGGYAVPSGSDPDFRTPDGDIIGAYFGPPGFPMGMINRADFGAGIVTSRTDWTGDAGTVIGQNSYVNVGIEAEYNSVTTLMTVHVEVYYTGNSPVSTNYLSVALLQNDIIGPQTGGTGNPYGDNGDGTYTHQHMFKDMITDVWGDPITTTTTGSFIDRTYYYSVPSDINGVPIIPADLELVAMVHETESDIESANRCYPTITSTVPSLDAVNTQVTTPAILCGDLSPEVTILNNGSTTLTSVQFSYDVNGGTAQNHTWNGSLATGQSTVVTLPVISFASQPTNSCNVAITNVNGGADNNTANNDNSASFESSIDGITTNVYLDLLTDDYGYETTWELYDEFGTIVYQSSGTYANNTQYNETFTLTPGCYNFVIHDDYGDGICCSYGSGHYILTDDNPITIINGGSFGSSEETPFKVGASTPPVASFTPSATTVCAGGSINFTDNSTNSPTSWSWDFGGGASNSTVQNPTATFNTPGTYTVSLTATNTGGSDTDTQTNLITVYANPSVGATATDVNCFGGTDGTATATASGGTPGYNYTWQGGQTTATATGLASGVYGVTISDANGCTASTLATVSAPTSAVSASITASNNPLCNGGTGDATANATGGTPGYSYAWQGGATTATATGLSDGTYGVTVTDANGCTALTSVTITEPTAVIASISSTSNPLCNGDSNGSASASGSGGTPGYTYLWTGGLTTSTINGLGDGTYNVTVTDQNGCSNTTSTIITEPTAINAFVSVTDASCYGVCDGGIVGSATGGSPGYSYEWTGGLVGGSHSGLCASTYNLTVTDGNGCTETSSGSINEPTEIVLTPSSTDATCGSSDGSATVGATGGAGNYIYLWQGGQTTSTITGIGSGTYNVTVTDINGCTNSISVNVSDVGGATLNSTSIPALCYNSSDGSATVVATGGTPGYTYAWSSGGSAATETGLPAGSYTVTVTDGSGCNTTEVVNVSAPTQITGSITVNDATCFGLCDGSASISATGGTPSYSYAWSTSGTAATETNLCVGSISITITDANGCIETFNSTVSGPTELTSSITSSTDPLCNGGTDGSATVSATGGTPNYSYLWSSGGNSSTETGLGDGTYTVTVTDNNGCISTQTVTITEPTAIVVAPTSTDENPQGAGNGTATATATGGTSPYTYSWDNGGTTETITGLSSGTYYVTVTDVNGCTETSSIFVDFFVSISAMGTEGFNYKVYPNPTDKYINLEISTDRKTELLVRIINNTGQLVFEEKINNVIGEYRNSIDVSQLASGMYEFVIITKDGMINKKIIKK